MEALLVCLHVKDYIVQCFSILLEGENEDHVCNSCQRDGRLLHKHCNEVSGGKLLQLLVVVQVSFTTKTT